MSAPTRVPSSAKTPALKQLRRITIVAWIDFALLVPLVVGVIIDQHGLAPIIGPIHGVGFLYEVYLAARGSAERWWGWWFPAVIVVTGGPLGALLGHNRAKREAIAAAE